MQRVIQSKEAIDLYLADLAASRPLSRDEEVAAAIRIEAAEAELFDAIVSGGLGLDELVQLARSFREGTVEAEALVRRGDSVEAAARSTLGRALDRFVLIEEERQELLLDLCVANQDATRGWLLAARESSRLERMDLLGSLHFHRDIIERIVAGVERRTRSLSGTQAHAQAAAALGVTPEELRAALPAIHEKRKVLEARKQRFVQSNLRLVVALAKRYRQRGVAFSDLVQEGNLGLLRAVDKFDHRVGVRFSTYAGWWIRQAIERLVVNQGCDVRVPIHKTESMYRTRRAARRLSHQLGRSPTVEEVAAAVGRPAELVGEMLEAAPRTYSIQSSPANANESDERPLGDSLADDRVRAADDAVIASAQRERARQVLNVLTDREQFVLTQRFGFDGGDGRTLREIGKDLSLSRERVRQIEAEALEKLREVMASEGETRASYVAA